jgi:hypothetical protein
MEAKFEGPIISKAERGDTFEVWRDNSAAEAFQYIGFFNGVRSVAANDPNVAFRGLWRKHRVGLPAGELVNLAEERRKRET